MDTCRVILCNLETVRWIFLPFTASYPLNEPSDSPVMLFESQIHEFVSANSQSRLVQSRSVFCLQSMYFSYEIVKSLTTRAKSVTIFQIRKLRIVTNIPQIHFSGLLIVVVILQSALRFDGVWTLIIQKRMLHAGESPGNSPLQRCFPVKITQFA